MLESIGANLKTVSINDKLYFGYKNYFSIEIKIKYIFSSSIKIHFRSLQLITMKLVVVMIIKTFELKVWGIYEI